MTGEGTVAEERKHEVVKERGKTKRTTEN